MFAGYETTSSALSCLIRELLINPSVESWLREEVDLLSWPPLREKATIAYDPKNAPRLDATVREVMRLTPPVGGFFRRTKRSLVIDGVVVPENRVIQVALNASNRYGIGDLETFRPERHFEDDCSVTLIPFGSGERVTHVAISLGGPDFIHQGSKLEGKVDIHSLDPKSPLYNDYRKGTFLFAKRIIK